MSYKALDYQRNLLIIIHLVKTANNATLFLLTMLKQLLLLFIMGGLAAQT